MCKPKPSRHIKRRRGAAAIEMALVAPFVLFLVFGSIEFSRMMMVRQAMTNAAREGCRQASLVTSRDYESAEERVRDRLQAIIPNSDDANVVRVHFSPEQNRAQSKGAEITVAVEVECKDASWLPPFLFAGVKIRTYASMGREAATED